MGNGHIIIHTHQGSISQLTCLVPSRCISTVALQYARLGQVNPVKLAVTEKVSPSFMHLRNNMWRCGVLSNNHFLYPYAGKRSAESPMQIGRKTVVTVGPLEMVQPEQ